MQYDKETNEKKDIKYWLREDNLESLKELITDGYTYEDLAKYMGVASDTLLRWRKKNKELRESLERAYDISVKRVDETMRWMACHKSIKRKQAFHPMTGEIVWLEEEELPDTKNQRFIVEHHKAIKEKYAKTEEAQEQVIEFESILDKSDSVLSQTAIDKAIEDERLKEIEEIDKANAQG